MRIDSGNSLRGNSVLLPTPWDDPHGAVLSMLADHSLSGGHMKAAGPISDAMSAVES